MTPYLNLKSIVCLLMIGCVQMAIAGASFLTLPEADRTVQDQVSTMSCCSTEATCACSCSGGCSMEPDFEAKDPLIRATFCGDGGSPIFSSAHASSKLCFGQLIPFPDEGAQISQIPSFFKSPLQFNLVFGLEKPPKNLPYFTLT